MSLILGVDPGDMTGYSLWEDNVEIERGILSDFDFYIFLDALPERGEIERIIYEDFRLLKGKAAAIASQAKGRRMVASQVIGACKLAAVRAKCPTTAMPTGNLPILYAHAGMKQATNHALSHGDDAYVQTREWMQRNGRVKSRLQLRREAAGD